jgi:hypothetical protein
MELAVGLSVPERLPAAILQMRSGSAQLTLVGGYTARRVHDDPPSRLGGAACCSWSKAQRSALAWTRSRLVEVALK